MKIKIKEDAEAIYIRSSEFQSSRLVYGLDRAKKMKAIAGEELVVGTKYLFTDQYNVVSIDGETAICLRIMDKYVDTVIDDYRKGRGKCDWCGHHSAKTEKGCNPCESGHEYMTWFDDVLCNPKG